MFVAWLTIATITTIATIVWLFCCSEEYHQQKKQEAATTGLSNKNFSNKNTATTAIAITTATTLIALTNRQGPI